jgi:hypothetical protein
MADSNVPITAGTGTSIDTYQVASGDHQQIVRDARGAAITHTDWALATTAAVVVSASASCLRMIAVLQGATGRVFLRFDGTNPTTTVYQWYLEPDDRYEIPLELSTFNIRAIAENTTGTLRISQITAA